MDPYTRIAGREIYRNPWLAVEVHDIVHPGGTRGEHLLVIPAPSVAVLVEDGEHFVFTTQPRFAARGEVLEVVKGGAEPGEAPLEAARRELREELGLEAARWEELGQIYEIPSIVQGAVAIFLASDVSAVPTAQEPSESITPVRIPIESALGEAMSREFQDALTLAVLYKYLMRP
ncbi:MAG TPA: NUDIX hydrolase [Candidatus Baltobacteraceae bacterium]|jgi:8-oxo-dGTP pyrophosphatase MutT (NUDIX family)|nr:NUDIX hydrolase [Candidatus Baltobacteraceae bacterium]